MNPIELDSEPARQLGRALLAAGFYDAPAPTAARVPAVAKPAPTAWGPKYHATAGKALRVYNALPAQPPGLLSREIAAALGDIDTNTVCVHLAQMKGIERAGVRGQYRYYRAT